MAGKNGMKNNRKRNNSNALASSKRRNSEIIKILPKLRAGLLAPTELSRICKMVGLEYLPSLPMSSIIFYCLITKGSLGSFAQALNECDAVSSGSSEEEVFEAFHLAPKQRLTPVLSAALADEQCLSVYSPVLTSEELLARHERNNFAGDIFAGFGSAQDRPMNDVPEFSILEDLFSFPPPDSFPIEMFDSQETLAPESLIVPLAAPKQKRKKKRKSKNSKKKKKKKKTKKSKKNNRKRKRAEDPDQNQPRKRRIRLVVNKNVCLLYTSDAADE
eukprot:TRINITY_DN2170_c0_g1_i1.p1 TRINITY_DN2170_c0_g1~~TRINITY_DN2170_c0_g1_i1.p1  ORF type:complete len:274 (-),score=58.64 TRINITY_DN2170_c0_g1_i1:17-838(-)